MAEINENLDKVYFLDKEGTEKLVQNMKTYTNEEISKKSEVYIINSDSSEFLSTLKIYELTEEQYQQKVESGDIEDNTIYLTPDDEIDLSPYATIEQLNEKSEASFLSAKEYSDSGDTATFEAAKQYIDTVMAKNSQVQFITWEADD